MLTESTYGLPRPRPVYQSGGGALSLAAVVASTVFDVDATVTASYPGSGTTWLNLVSAPADGSAQADYHFTINGWSYNGTGAVAYFESDGTADYARMAANTPFTRDLHKTTGGSDFWMAMAIRHGATGQFINNRLTNSSEIGVLTALNSNRLQMAQRGASASSATGSATMTGGVDYVIISSHSHSENKTRHWVGTATAQEMNQTFSTTTADASGPLTIGAMGNNSLSLSSGTRIYTAAMGNEYLDDTKAALIITALEARHGRSYI